MWQTWDQHHSLCETDSGLIQGIYTALRFTKSYRHTNNNPDKISQTKIKQSDYKAFSVNDVSFHYFSVVVDEETKLLLQIIAHNSN